MNDKINLAGLSFAHRGIHNNLNIPENSMKAFKRAIEKHTPIELDIHLTKDNKIVVFHDSNLKRMTGINKRIKNCTYSELYQINLLNTEEKIPLLEDVLLLINGKVLLDIEIKDDKRMKTTIKLLIKLLDNYNGNFIIQSFHLKYLYYLKNKRKNYVIGLLSTSISCRFKMVDSKTNLKLLKPIFIAYSKNIVHCNRIQEIRKNGIYIFAWTIKTKKEIQELYKYADSLISEYF